MRKVFLALCLLVCSFLIYDCAAADKSAVKKPRRERSSTLLPASLQGKWFYLSNSMSDTIKDMSAVEFDEHGHVVGLVNNFGEPVLMEYQRESAQGYPILK